MKRFFMFFVSFVTLFFSASLLCKAEGVELPSAETPFTVDLTTFAGVVALVSAIVTQLLKLIPAVQNSKLAKIGISVAVGIACCFVAWGLKISPLFVDSLWWHVLLYGIAAGLSGCGFYDVVKAIADLFKKKEAE